MIYKLKPATKDYVWGGTNLSTQYNIKSESESIAEAWVLSAHKDGQCVVDGGAEDGKTLSELIELYPDILGTAVEKFDFFPILIKLIDAKQALSVQVHPSDKYALENEGQYGKTEMWYIMDAKPNSHIYFGFNTNLTQSEFTEHISCNTIESVLNKVPVQKGQVFFIEAGTIHAIGAGIVIAEVQQNSNLTYRVYDYDRKDSDGNLRELHIDKSKTVINYNKQQYKDYTPNDLIIAKCEYFTVNKYEINGVFTLEMDESSFRHFLIIDGNGAIFQGESKIEFTIGESFIIPASNQKVTVKGNCLLIVTNV